MEVDESDDEGMEEVEEELTTKQVMKMCQKKWRGSALSMAHLETLSPSRRFHLTKEQSRKAF